MQAYYVRTVVFTKYLVLNNEYMCLYLSYILLDIYLVPTCLIGWYPGILDWLPMLLVLTTSHVRTGIPLARLCR